MSNVNDFKFAELLKQYQAKVLAPQIKRRAEAFTDFEKVSKGTDKEATEVANAKVANYDAWLKFYQQFYDEGIKLCTQHENIVNHLSKWYGKWREDISNEGRQETELMSSQADMLNEIFSEMYSDIKPLNLDIKPPKAMNL